MSPKNDSLLQIERIVRIYAYSKYLGRNVRCVLFILAEYISPKGSIYRRPKKAGSNKVFRRKRFPLQQVSVVVQTPSKNRVEKVLLSLLKAIKSVAFDRENHENLSLSPHNK